MIFGGLLWGLARTVFLKRTSGVSVFAIFNRKKTVIEVGLALIAAVLDFYLVARLVAPAIDNFVLQLTAGLPLVGVSVMTAGLTAVLIAQIQMGVAWRIGVPVEREKGQSLVTTGIFVYSRNPIYLGIAMFIAGALLIAPGPLTLSCFAAYIVLIYQQVMREETFMAATFGTEFEVYCKSVRRWL